MERVRTADGGALWVEGDVVLGSQKDRRTPWVV